MQEIIFFYLLTVLLEVLKVSQYQLKTRVRIKDQPTERLVHFQIFNRINIVKPMFVTIINVIIITATCK